jgi:hypothetical protein
MSERGIELHQMADGQISELIGVLSGRGEAAMSLPVPGSEKMGDGTIAACALHTADRYQLIAGFLEAAGQLLSGPRRGEPGASSDPTLSSRPQPRARKPRRR